MHGDAHIWLRNFKKSGRILHSRIFVIICFEEFQKQWGVFGSGKEQNLAWLSRGWTPSTGWRKNPLLCRSGGRVWVYDFRIFFRAWRVHSAFSHEREAPDWTKPPQVLSKRENSKHKTESFSVILSFFDSFCFFSPFPASSFLLAYVSLVHHLPSSWQSS